VYLHARAWGIQPSEFWAMTIGEWFLEYNFRDKDSGTYAGSLTRADVDDLMDWMDK
jgi:hypothetical protein